MAVQGMRVLVADADSEAAGRVADEVDGSAVAADLSQGDGVDAVLALVAGPYGSPEYAAAKAGLIRFTFSVTDWVERFGVRVACVVPGWIGLPRALDEVAAMPAGARPTLIPPGEIATEVLALVSDAESGGRVVVIDEGERARVLEA
jgi:NAD(P)-dependent dehydrogenase (short-subunit alcohol dehydrogenase family)